MDPITTPQAEPSTSNPYSYPEKPFESIGFCLSGGGFRAATFGLGVLSLLHEIKWMEEGKETSLLEKIRFVSSASGGTIPLAVYVAALHHGVAFKDFYAHLNREMTGEALVDTAIGLLKDDREWTPGGKNRNMINAFAKAYDCTLFSLVPQGSRTLGALLPQTPLPGIHVEEFCFNATDFYTGISFRFQGGWPWQGNKGGIFGNANIGIDWTDKDAATSALYKIKMSDILAASSCFPMGFEPIVFPKDFTYSGGPSEKELKNALRLETLSWDDKVSEAENARSPRAVREKAFAQEKTFGLMDGGIVDNQGLNSLLIANDRGKPEGQDPKTYHRFDLLMVSDVTSFYMSPYKIKKLEQDKAWMQKSLGSYWTMIIKGYRKLRLALSWSVWVLLALVILCALPLVLEGVSVAAITLIILAVLLLAAAIAVKRKFDSLLRRYSVVEKSLRQESLQDLISLHLAKESFTKRTALKVVGYLQGISVGSVLEMISSRTQSAAIMIGDIFLKHIRRLIYGKLFEDSRYIYRKLDNFIYKLTFTNNKNRSRPAFEPREKEETKQYNARKAAFLKEVEEGCLLTEAMQETAECAYNTGTTMWFENEQEEGPINNRKALLATGQFTTCCNLLAYCMSLKHSRHYPGLDARYRERLDTIGEQLKKLMKEFAADPYYLQKQLESINT